MNIGHFRDGADLRELKRWLLRFYQEIDKANGFRVTMSTAQAIGKDAWVKLTGFDTESYNDGDMWDDTDKQFVARETDRYRFNLAVGLDTMTAGETLRVGVYDGTNYYQGGMAAAVTADLKPSAIVSVTLQLNKDATIAPYAYHTDSGDINTLTDVGITWFEGHRVV